MIDREHDLPITKQAIAVSWLPPVWPAPSMLIAPCTLVLVVCG
jgi:hypothetical protein